MLNIFYGDMKEAVSIRQVILNMIMKMNGL